MAGAGGCGKVQKARRVLIAKAGWWRWCSPWVGLVRPAAGLVRPAAGLVRPKGWAGLRVDGAAEQALAVVEGEDLAAGEAALGLLETDAGGGARFWEKVERHARIAVADAARAEAWCEDGGADPTE